MLPLAGTKFVTGFETILDFLDLSIISQALSVTWFVGRCFARQYEAYPF